MTPFDRSKDVLERISVRRVLEESNLPIEIATAIADALEAPRPEGGYIDPEYARRNPLGGPAKVFDAMAARIRAGEDYYAVLDDYGFMVRPSTPQQSSGK